MIKKYLWEEENNPSSQDMLEYELYCYWKDMYEKYHSGSSPMEYFCDKFDEEEKEEKKRESSRKYKEYYEKNKESILEKKRESSKRYKERNREKIKEQSKKYYERNKESILQRNITYHKEKRKKNREEGKFVYCIQCLVTNKKYIGSSNNLKDRILSHFQPSQWKKYKDKYPLYVDMKLYGVENFIWGVIEEVEEGVNILERETYWIKEYDTIQEGYNTYMSYLTEEEKVEYERKRKPRINKKPYIHSMV